MNGFINGHVINNMHWLFLLHMQQKDIVQSNHRYCWKVVKLVEK